MPEPAREPSSRNAIRRAVEEGSGRLPNRVRELPGFAVRTAVVGVGKLLDASAKARAEYGELKRTGVRPTLERLRGEGIDLLRSGVRTVTHQTPTTPARPTPPTAAPGESDTRAAPAADQVTHEAVRPVSGQDTAHLPEQFAAAPAEDELPLPNYDALTLGSIRARLRNLTISDLGTLLAYERARQNRSNVVTMYENRILKLEREQGA